MAFLYWEDVYTRAESDARYLMLTTANAPLTGNLPITKSAPKLQFNDTDDGTVVDHYVNGDGFYHIDFNFQTDQPSKFYFGASGFYLLPSLVGSIVLNNSGITFAQGLAGGSLSPSAITMSSAQGGSNLNGSSAEFRPGGSTGTGFSSSKLYASGGGSSGSSASAVSLVAEYKKTAVEYVDGYTLQSVSTTTGLRVERTGGKIGFLGATPVVRQLAATDPMVALSNLGLRVAGTAFPITTTGVCSFGQTTVAGLTTTAGLIVNRVTTAMNYTTQKNDLYVGVTSTAAPRTITLIAAATAGNGAILIIKDESGGAAANNITIDANGAETIDGNLTAVINTNYGSYSLICNGTNWFIV